MTPRVQKPVRRSRAAKRRPWRRRAAIGGIVAALLLLGGLIGAALDHAEYRHTCPDGTVQWTSRSNHNHLICLQPGQAPEFTVVPPPLTPQS